MNATFNWEFPYPSKRMPILAKNIVSTSQPLTSQVGLRMILQGGNAADAAIIYKLEDRYLGASDWRKDGQAVGY